MRRFIASLPGKVLGQLVIMALLLPTLTFALAARASAQVATLPLWAVVEFSNRKSSGTAYGKTAATAVINELAKTGRYELVPQEGIQRAIETIGVENPPKGQTNLLRLGQEVRATTLVTGEIVDYDTVNRNGNKQGRVSMLVILYDVASGLPINGAVKVGLSTERPSNATEDTLITDAIAQAANLAVRDLQKPLPSGTVQNTTSGNSAFVNQGTRVGFRAGLQVVVTRGRQQVATARVTEADYDSSTVKVERGDFGIQPGDKVRAIFTVPEVKPGFTNQDQAKTVRRPRTGFPTALVTVLIVLGIVALLLSSGNSGGQKAAEAVVNEAINDPLYVQRAEDSGVKISWRRNGFYSGTQTVVQWQIFRSDVPDVPVMVVGRENGEARNLSRSGTTGAGSFLYLNRGTAGGIDCNNTVATNATAPVQPAVEGTPYIYSVELVYQVLNLDLPNPSTTTTGSTTGLSTTGATTATGTTATTATATNGNTTANTTGATATATGSTAGTNGTSGTGTTATGTGTTAGTTGVAVFPCFFTSSRSSASGPATPLRRPTITTPSEGQQITGDVTFTYNTVGGAASLPLEYVLEFSSTRDFLPGTWARVADPQVRSLPLGTSVTFPSVAVSGDRLPSFLRGVSPIYFRVGVRNLADQPGPEQSRNGQRYVYTYPPRSFLQASSPPANP